MRRRLLKIVRNKIRYLINLVLGPPPTPLYVMENPKWFHSSIIDGLTPQFVKIGRNFISSHNSIILSHDASYFLFTDKYRIESVEIGDNVFLGAGAVVLPGIKIGNRVVIGAGSIVKHDIPDDCVVAGNPAKIISSIDEYIKKAQTKGVLYSSPYTLDQIRIQNGIPTVEQKNELQKSAIEEYHRRNPGVNNWITYTEKE